MTFGLIRQSLFACSERAFVPASEAVSSLADIPITSESRAAWSFTTSARFHPIAGVAPAETGKMRGYVTPEQVQLHEATRDSKRKEGKIPRKCRANEFGVRTSIFVLLINTSRTPIALTLFERL